MVETLLQETNLTLAKTVSKCQAQEAAESKSGDVLVLHTPIIKNIFEIYLCTSKLKTNC